MLTFVETSFTFSSLYLTISIKRDKQDEYMYFSTQAPKTFNKFREAKLNFNKRRRMSGAVNKHGRNVQGTQRLYNRHKDCITLNYWVSKAYTFTISFRKNFIYDLLLHLVYAHSQTDWHTKRNF